MNLPTYTSGILFSKAHRLVRARVDDVLDEYGLNPIHWSILGATMQAAEGIRLAGVAELLGVKAPVVTTEANQLIKRGLVRRIPHHTDKRAKLLVITPEGKRIGATIDRKLSQQIGAMLNGVSEEDIAGFQKTLEIIIKNAE